MKKIDWETADQKREAYRKLKKTFDVSTGYVSLAMSYKRSGDKPEKMRDMALKELDGRLLDSENSAPVQKRTTKILNSKGEVEKVLTS